MTASSSGIFPVAASLIIPHRPPMARVESLERADRGGALVRARVEAGPLFVRPDETVEPLVLLEIIAQACAAYGGWRAGDAGRGNRAVFLVGVRCFEVLGKAVAGGSMEITVTLDKSFGGFHLFRGVLRQDGHAVAQASLKAYHPEEPTTGA